MPFPRHMTKKWGAELKWVCEACGRRWVDGWLLEGHHKIPRHNGGKDTRENFQLLCQHCHAEAHDKLARTDAASVKCIKGRIAKSNGGRWK